MQLVKNDKVKAKELAEYFKVSLRTIQRDVEAIINAGIPIEAIVGKSGGYFIEQEYLESCGWKNKTDNELILCILEILNKKYGKMIMSSLDSDKYILEDFIKFKSGEENNEVKLKLEIDVSVEERIKKYFKIANVKRISESLGECEAVAFNDEFLYNVLLSFGDKIKVVEPTNISEMLKVEANNIVKKYM